uniref:YHYH domain-containing protein n=1 Tax=Paramoeba aestuarina TaxID=180227 RepID=A0A7S4PJX8_9EUKA|mmetsp:Transcript_722/g.1231  ORF Transcript_722/g.1231 Transcript_722/m.1231 type:complete len:284 (+) Transcript_722:44-895(+)|eukprot:CAMPEP_0201508916 /NCGR_PEP_ID=MMETSP0161_2-20130828/2115_1 /ASSEMBLY_ACC=CAM_ASM_000251 /TAXON_ID=180227 /ORGANISM="Neoparamoeba aestuarina, Strain SoJaBio B1-5/56/2" /LENGTH=283 /DNA_ID=CAMNT_0047903709 /DNA_START=19 /DNA_END=870 /DNA_ORIENTATION=-
MLSSSSIVLLLLVTPFVISQHGPPPDQNTCTDNVPEFPLPQAKTSECEDFSNGNSYDYPSDFNVTNNVTWYECPESGLRMVVANDIPDHDVKVNNPNNPCYIPYWIVFPLYPELADSVTEPSNLGIIAMAIDGVSVYGAQEGGGTNAVEPAAGSMVQDAQYWYGHCETEHRWHYHNPQLGHENMPDENTLMAYAMDGFPIYGPVSNPDSDLDECNGMKHDDGSYRYHVRTLDQVDGDASYCNGDSPAIQWNYVIGCWAGELGKTTVTDASDLEIPTDCQVVKY